VGSEEREQKMGKLSGMTNKPIGGGGEGEGERTLQKFDCNDGDQGPALISICEKNEKERERTENGEYKITELIPLI
jgi:hypothetical protein